MRLGPGLRRSTPQRVGCRGALGQLVEAPDHAQPHRRLGAQRAPLERSELAQTTSKSAESSRPGRPRFSFESAQTVISSMPSGGTSRAAPRPCRRRGGARHPPPEPLPSAQRRLPSRITARWRGSRGRQHLPPEPPRIERVRRPCQRHRRAAALVDRGAHCRGIPRRPPEAGPQRCATAASDASEPPHATGQRQPAVDAARFSQRARSWLTAGGCTLPARALNALPTTSRRSPCSYQSQSPASMG